MVPGMSRFAPLLFLCGLAWAVDAPAWSGFGHRLVGELAERRLSPEARAQVRDLLRDEAEPTLAAVSPWPDRVRDEPAYAWTAPLHYVRIHDRRCRYAASRDCEDGECVVGAIERYARELGDSRRSRQERAEALKFLVHFVADVHQPLHSGRRPDKGGNEFQISIDGEGTNLHSVWDYHILASAGRDFDEWITRLAAEPPVPRGAKPARWAEASCRLTDADGFYPARPGKLPPGYLERHRPVAEARLRAAAAELAWVIERALAPRAPAR
jgi:hypothetical protein